ncbi:MAG TPA: sialidase family protein [Mycobacteriales bacterium]|nr:sialidase family protein [Mycobacteriales bacterium]
MNPKNPNNIIVIYLRNNDAFVPNAAHGQVTAPTDTRDVTQQIQGCDYAVTFDGGRHWTRHPLPANDFTTDPAENNCSDSIVVFDRRGTAYVMASAYASLGFVGDSEYRLIRSDDGGRTWSKPGIVAPGTIGQGSHPQDYDGVRTYDDRPWLAIDPQTRTLYIDGTQVRADGSGTGTVYLTASSDGGRTWRDPIVVPAANLASAPLGAAFGTVALAVMPPNGEPGCTCLDFLTSSDYGRRLHRQHTTIPAVGGPQTVADPTHRGHFTVMTNDGQYMRFYRTSDFGRTWQSSTRLSVQNTTVVKPWIAYSPSGILGVGWRATRSDGSYAFYAAVSANSGASFLGLRRLSHRWSPPAPPYYVAGDDTSTVTVTRDHLYAAWGDWRGSGLEDVYWGGFPLPR